MHHYCNRVYPSLFSLPWSVWSWGPYYGTKWIRLCIQGVPLSFDPREPVYSLYKTEQFWLLKLLSEIIDNNEQVFVVRPWYAIGERARTRVDRYQGICRFLLAHWWIPRGNKGWLFESKRTMNFNWRIIFISYQ